VGNVKPVSLILVLAALASACGGSDSETRDAWCNQRPSYVTSAASSINPDAGPNTTGRTNIEQLWGPEAAAEVKTIQSDYSMEPLERIHSVTRLLRDVNPEVWGEACSLAFRTYGSLTSEAAIWCGQNPILHREAAERMGLRLGDARFPGAGVEACKSAYANR